MSSHISFLKKAKFMYLSFFEVRSITPYSWYFCHSNVFSSKPVISFIFWMPALFIFVSSIAVKHILYWILPLFMTRAVFKADSGDNTVQMLMQPLSFSSSRMIHSWRWQHGNDRSVTLFSLNREEVGWI